MKTCTKCHEEKSLTEFNKHKIIADGHRTICRECCKVLSVKYAEENAERIRKYQLSPQRIANKKEYDSRPEVKEARAEYNSRPEVKKARQEHKKTESYKKSQSKSALKYKDKYPNAYRAQRRFGNAIKKGKIVRPSNCSECQSTVIIEGHHDCYDHPFKVRWLCKKCHTFWHLHNTPLNRI